jgi:hypothetical protein
VKRYLATADVANADTTVLPDPAAENQRRYIRRPQPLLRVAQQICWNSGADQRRWRVAPFQHVIGFYSLPCIENDMVVLLIPIIHKRGAVIARGILPPAV